MIQIPDNPRYTANSERCTGDQMPCVVCGKPITVWRWAVRLVDGGTMIGTDEDAVADPEGDLGYYPIGSDCLKKHPEIKPYAVKQ